MAQVKAYLHDEIVYDERCKQKEVDEHISSAFNSYGNIDDIDNVIVEVIDDDGTTWSPV